MVDSNITTTLNILNDSLEKKFVLLEQIMSLTSRQEEALSLEEVNLDAFSNLMDNKQVLIEEVNKLDDGFGPTFERIKDRVKDEPKVYSDQIKQMQATINKIGDLALKIQGLELKNQARFKEKMSQIKKEVRGFRSVKKVAKSYSDNYKKHMKIEDNQVFDREK